MSALNSGLRAVCGTCGRVPASVRALVIVGHPDTTDVSVLCWGCAEGTYGLMTG